MFVQFVQNVNRRISQFTAESENVSISEQENDNSYEDDNSEALKFFYNLDGDYKDAIEEPDKTYDYEEILPEIFEDGNFELVDGLIMLTENQHRTKTDLKSRILPVRRRSQFSTKNEYKPRAA